jgi:hypothetical protein
LNFGVCDVKNRAALSVGKFTYGELNGKNKMESYFGQSRQALETQRVRIRLSVAQARSAALVSKILESERTESLQKSVT